MITSLIKNFCHVFLLVIISVGCISGRQFTYMQTKEESAQVVKNPETFTIPSYTYRIRPGDLLSIQIVPGVSSKYNTSEIFPPTDKYVVSDTGTVAFANVGVIPVAGLTAKEASVLIRQRISEVFGEVYVQVRSLGFTVTVFGEVRSPGTHIIEKERLTIYEAITLAGDLTDFADKENVRLIREENGIAKSVYLDLTNDKILTSPYFFLEPGDVIYAQPMVKMKKRALSRQEISFYLTVVNTLFIIVNIISILRR